MVYNSVMNRMPIVLGTGLNTDHSSANRDNRRFGPDPSAIIKGRRLKLDPCET